MGQFDDSLIAKAADAIRGKWPNQHDGDFYGEGVEGDCEHVARTVIEVVESEFTLIPKNLREGLRFTALPEEELD